MIPKIQVYTTHEDVLISSGKDNVIHLWDKRFENKRTSLGQVLSVPVKSIVNAHCVATKIPGKSRVSLSNNSGVSASIFLPLHTNTIISAGSSDGLLKVWDLRGKLKQCVHQVNPNMNEKRSYGITSLSASSTYVYVSTMNSKYS